MDAMSYNEMQSVLVTVMLWLWSRSLSIAPLRTGYIQVKGLSVEALLSTTLYCYQPIVTALDRYYLLVTNLVVTALAHYYL